MGDRRHPHPQQREIGAAANSVAFSWAASCWPSVRCWCWARSGPAAAITAVWPLVLAIAWLAWLPSQFLLFWGVRRISPVRTGILLMTELVSGVATAAWLSGDPITWQQAVGGALISGRGIGRCADQPERPAPAPVPLAVVQE